MIEPALIKLIKSAPAVSAIIGTRIHADTDPQTLPRPKVTYTRISTERGLTNSGPVDSPRSRFRLDCWADQLETAATLSNEIRKAIDGYRGTVVVGGGPSAKTYRVDGIHIRDEYNNPVPTSQPGAQTKIHRYSLNIHIDFKE